MDSMIIYGDSISTGTHGEGAYLDALKKCLKVKHIQNYAIGSSGLSAKTPNSMLKVLEGQEENKEGRDVDLILVWHGTNDWYWGAELGSVDQEEDDTFYGAIKKAVKVIRERNPEGLLVWITPIFRYEKPDKGDTPGNANFTKNHTGHTLDEYTQAICLMGRKLGFPVIEMGMSVGIYEENEIGYMEDQVHPNVFGYRKIERVLEKEITKYWYYHTGEKQGYDDLDR
ncbi:MAG: SGNH/GDSL hydrolase family protein [Mobilitalea sp.]